MSEQLQTLPICRNSALYALASGPAERANFVDISLSFNAHHRLFIWGLIQVVTSNPLL